MNLRSYQRKACAETWRGLQTEHTLLESPTGTGKTVMALAVSEKAVAERCGPVLIVAPTDEIYGQMISTYQRAGWMVHADKAERHVQPAKAMEQALDGCKVVIVASLGTLRLRDRVERYPRDGWALTILDECHHAPASTWQGVREYFDQPWMGMTATPERAGMKPLWPVHVRAFENGLMEAIHEGWLVPFNHQYACGVTQDDYDAMKSDDAREVDPALTAALATITEHLQGRQGLSFWPRTRAATQAAKALRADGTMTARALVGSMPPDERKLALRQYAASTLQMLMLCQVGVEGLDVPPAAMLAIFQQTKSKVRVAQQVGRVLRPDAACLAGLDEATPEERRAAIAASSKPSALVASIAPPEAIDGWETPGRLLWGDLPEPVLIEIDRRQRAGKDLETARKEALNAEAEQAAKRKAAREEHERREAAAAPARARAVAEARPYELQDHGDAVKQARRKTITSAWERWTNRAKAALMADATAPMATPEQAGAIAKLSCEYLRVPANDSNLDRVRSKVLEWDRKTAKAAQHALRCMTGHFQVQRQRA